MISSLKLASLIAATCITLLSPAVALPTITTTTTTNNNLSTASLGRRSFYDTCARPGTYCVSRARAHIGQVLTADAEQRLLCPGSAMRQSSWRVFRTHSGLVSRTTASTSVSPRSEMAVLIQSMTVLPPPVRSIDSSVANLKHYANVGSFASGLTNVENGVSECRAPGPL